MSQTSRRPAFDPPTAADVESLLVEADRRARMVVCDELAGQRAEAYRNAVAAQLAGRTSTRTRADSRQAGPPTPTHRSIPQQLAPDQPEQREQPERSEKPERSDQQGRSEEPAAETAWYLYGIARAADLDEAADLADLSGVEDRTVQVVATDDLAAVTSNVPLEGFRASDEEPDLAAGGWLQQAVRTHERVVERLCARTTVLPLRFGALYPSRDHIRAVLHKRADELRSELDRLDGTAEWGVRARPVEQEPAEQGTAAAGDVADGTEWMLRRRQVAAAREQTRRARTRFAAELDTYLTRHARETLVRSSAQHGEPSAVVFDAVYLVPQTATADFHTDLDQVSSRCAAEGLEVEVTGPWPPYHFVRLPADEPEPTAARPHPAPADPIPDDRIPDDPGAAPATPLARKGATR